MLVGSRVNIVLPKATLSLIGPIASGDPLEPDATNLVLGVIAEADVNSVIGICLRPNVYISNFLSPFFMRASFKNGQEC